MANSKELFDELVNKIRLKEERDEIESIIYLLLENRLGLTRSDILQQKELNAVSATFDDIVARINSEEPIQYVLGEAWFYGRRFTVDSSVLIPRPETELIVDEVRQSQPKSILDIGTGSGCIAITLAKEIRNATVFATDVSAAALMTAVENAKRNEAEVKFFRHDILNDELPWTGLDYVVSNPPYITMSEKPTMRKNVTDFEPNGALFVPNDDPLLFYSAIAMAGRKILGPRGKVVVEINERFGREVAELFEKNGYDSVSVVRDLAGKDRIVTAQ